MGKATDDGKLDPFEGIDPYAMPGSTMEALKRVGEAWREVCLTTIVQGSKDIERIKMVARLVWKKLKGI